MSKTGEALHSIAENDTPSTVDVPKTMAGLIVWAVGRWGGGAIIGAACLYGIVTVYQDLRAAQAANTQEQRQMNAALVEVIRNSTQVNAQTVAALESIRVEIHDAHARTGTIAKPSSTPRP